ncbi:alpha/beta hydrolase [uncultured Mycolicibacterium sp.]|uniref:alpha/beta hydrolase n=1 Tax=uncultured Mycolicibacterium sp. TaxID=2320817 RepID=UPI0026255C71|nr:alpha/beta hydrolase [uncultured Mycolicibacterium sp.]
MAVAVFWLALLALGAAPARADDPPGAAGGPGTGVGAGAQRDSGRQPGAVSARSARVATTGPGPVARVTNRPAPHRHRSARPTTVDTAVIETATIETSGTEPARPGPRSRRPGAKAPAEPGSPGLLRAVGSVVFDVFGALTRAVSNPPLLPPGSTVTVRTSTLELPGIDRTVQADWYFPADPASATGLIYLQHGFFATGPMYSYTAAQLAESTNSIVVAPTLSSNAYDPTGRWLGGAPTHQAVAELFAGARTELLASAEAAYGAPIDLPSRFVLAGHSLGGMLVAGVARRLVDNGAVDDLAGILLLDAVDTHGLLPEALAVLGDDVPVRNIAAERYVWNAYGVVGDELGAGRPGRFTGVYLAGGRHIDHMQGANPVLQFFAYLLAGFSEPANVEAVRILAADWVNGMFAGDPDPPLPAGPIHIATPAGTAVGWPLPYPDDRVVLGTPWDPLVDLLLRLVVPTTA